MSILKPRYVENANLQAAFAGKWLGPFRGTNNFGFQCAWATPAARVIPHNAADSVVASTGTWLFTNGAFNAGDVGGTFTVANASHGGNNSTFTILTVVDATHVTTATTGLVNETFGSSVTASVQQLSPTGVFAVEVSEDGPATVAGGDDVSGTSPPVQPANRLGATPLDSTAALNGSQPAASAGNCYFNFVNIAAPWLRITYTPTTGGGLANVGASGGSR